MISEPIPFLANIALIAHADGKLSPSELGQMEAIRVELKMRKGDYNKAVSLVGGNAHQLTPVGTFADQVKNLELMLRVAYSDDDLDEKEGGLVGEFCSMIGVSQEQLDRVAQEVLNTLKNQNKVCPSCGASADTDAKFCPKCGASLASDEAPVLVDFDIPKTGIAIEFADSSAASFASALDLAKATNGYQTCQKLKKTWHLAVFPSDSLTVALPLASALGSIRNKKAFLNGEENSWNEIFGFAHCAAQRVSAYRPVEYCFGKDENRINPWGCKQAHMNWTDWADWFSYGAWEKSGVLGSKVVWRFDKERIQHELATKLYRFRFCPHMIPNLAQAVLRHLPDTVAPDKDKDWSFNHQYEEIPGAIKVIEKEGGDGYTYTNEYWSDGVRPKGLKKLSDILTKALAEVGGCGISPQSLLK